MSIFGGPDDPTIPIPRLNISTNLPVVPGAQLTPLPQIQVPNVQIADTPVLNLNRQPVAPPQAPQAAQQNPLLSLLGSFGGLGGI